MTGAAWWLAALLAAAPEATEQAAAPAAAGPEGAATAEAGPEVHGRTRTFVRVGARPYYELVGDTGRLVARREVPVVQDFFLDARTGVPGLSVALDAWVALDAGEQVHARRLLAEITEGYLEWRTRPLTLRAGRVFVPSAVARQERIDGAWVRLHPKASLLGATLSVDLYGGLPVTPSYGEEVLRASGTPTLASDPLILAAGGADWSRPGDWVAGAMVDLRFGPRGAVGLGFVRQDDLAIVDREAAVARFELAPLEAIGLSGYGAFDTYGREVEDARLSVTGWLRDGLRVGLYGRYTNPSLLLPSSSIFSVFAHETHRELGLEADLWLWRSTRLSFSGELRETDAEPGRGADAARGHRVALSLRGPLPFARGGRGVVALERLFDGWYGGYDYARVGAEAPVLGALSLSAEGGVLRLSEPAETGGPGERTALRGTMAAVVDGLKGWRAAVALRATEAPGVSSDVAVIVRIEWNSERTF